MRYVLIALSLPLFADQAGYVREEPDLPPAPNVMTGDWGGMRSRLQDKGLTITSSYTTDMLGNPAGGRARGFAYAGSFGLNLDFNLETLAGWKGLEFFSSFVWRTGTNLTTRKIGNQFPVAQLYGSETVKLNELYLKETLFDGSLVLKAGLLNAGNDFLQSPLYYQFISNAFDGNPISVFFNTPSFTAYPNSTWGAFLSVKPADAILAKFAVYNANTKIFQNRYHGFNFTLESTNGVIWIAEWDYLNNQKGRGLPGNYKIGFIYQTGRTQEFNTRFVNGDWCAYLLIDQTIYRPVGDKTGRGLTPFVALLFAPQNRNLFPFFVTTGLVWKGPWAKRPTDSANIGLAYGGYSSSQASAQREAARAGIPGPFGNLPQSFEAVLEANYWIQVNNWLAIVPDVQYIINPKGTNALPNALVVGAQIGFVL